MENLKEIVESSFSYAEVLRKLGQYENGRNRASLKKLIEKESLDTSHFNPTRHNLLRRKERTVYTHCFHPDCGKEHDGSYGSGKFCSEKCAKRYASYEKREEINAKISRSLTGRISIRRGEVINFKNGELTKIGKERLNGGAIRICPSCQKLFAIRYGNIKFCSKKCVDVGLVDVMRNKVLNGTHKGWAPRTKLSFAEKYYKDQLDANGYAGKYIVNYPISQMDLGMDRPYCYYIDFYFPETRLCLEIDGRQHKLQERVESDAVRDSYLKQSGYTLYRIPWNGIRSKPAIERTKEDVSKLLSFLEDFDSLIV